MKLVIMDLDGTLVDTAPDIAASINSMLADLGLPAYDRDTIADWVGSGVSRLIKRTLTGQVDGEPEPALYQRADPLFRRYYAARVSQESTLYPGVAATLEALRIAGFELACITNKPEAFTVPLLKDLGIHDHFGLLLSGDALPRNKPDPLPLLHACDYFAVGPNYSVMVGDSVNDTEAARAAGMPVICVTYGYNRGVDVRELAPAAVIDDLSELPNYIR
ncbi:MAG: phosphoglycolate phosphatase, partial [Acidiferrobacterales bacterium]